MFDEIKEKAIEEIQTKSFGVTKQFLEIHEIVHEDNKPKISRIDTEKSDGTLIVYFSVVGEKFYFVIYLDSKPCISVRWVEIQPYHSISFRATSEILTVIDLANLTTLMSTSRWNKGDKKKIGSSFHKFSFLEFEPDPGADEFEDKMNKMLDFLERDIEGVKRLVEKANGYIQVISVFHNGNTMLGGHHLNKDIIKRLAFFNIAVDFDEYAEGNMFT